jgi:hypothetical protein
MMHFVLNCTNLGIRSMFFGVTDSTLICDTVLVLWSYELDVNMGYGLRSFGICIYTYIVM